MHAFVPRHLGFRTKDKIYHSTTWLKVTATAFPQHPYFLLTTPL